MDYIFNVRAEFGNSLENLQKQYENIKKSIESHSKENPIKLAVDLNVGNLSLNSIQEKLKGQKLSVDVGEVKFDSSEVSSSVGQTVNKISQQIKSELGNITVSGFNKGNYRSLLESMGLSESQIDKAVKDIQKLGITITKITGTDYGTDSKGNNFITALIQGEDKLGRVVTLSQKIKTIIDEEGHEISNVSNQVISVTSNIKQQVQQQQKANKELEKQKSLYSDLNSQFKALYTTQSSGKSKIDGFLLGNDNRLSIDKIANITKEMESYKTSFNSGQEALEKFENAVKNGQPINQDWINTIRSSITEMRAYGKVVHDQQSGSVGNFDAKDIKELQATATIQLGAFEEKVKSSGLVTESLTGRISELKKTLADVKVSDDYSKFTDQFRTAKAEFDSLKQSASLATKEITNSSKLSQLKNDWTDLFKTIKEYGIEWENLARGKNAGELMTDFKTMKSYMSQDSLNTEELKRAKAIYDSIKSSIDQVVEAKKKSSQTEAFNFDKDRALQNLSEIKKQIQELGTDESQLTYKTEGLETAFANITDKNSLGTFNKMLGQTNQEVKQQELKIQEVNKSIDEEKAKIQELIKLQEQINIQKTKITNAEIAGKNHNDIDIMKIKLEELETTYEKLVTEFMNHPAFLKLDTSELDSLNQAADKAQKISDILASKKNEELLVSSDNLEKAKNKLDVFEQELVKVGRTLDDVKKDSSGRNLREVFEGITDTRGFSDYQNQLRVAETELVKFRQEQQMTEQQAKQLSQAQKFEVDFVNSDAQLKALQQRIIDLNIDVFTLSYTFSQLNEAQQRAEQSRNTNDLQTFKTMLGQVTKEVDDQTKDWQRLTDVINKAYGEATNASTNSKAIQDPATIKLLRDQYDTVIESINNLRNATADTYDSSKKAAEQAIQAFIEYSKVLQNSERDIQATETAIKKLQTDTQKGLFAQNSNNSEVVQLKQDITDLSNQYSQLQAKFQSEGATQEVIQGFTQLDNQIKSTSERAKELQSSLKSVKDAAALEDRKSNLNNKIETWLRNNTRASESMRQSMKSLQTQIQSADKQTLTHLTQQFNELNRTAQQTGQIGKSALDIFKEKAAKFAGWFGLANAFMMITNEAKQALVTLKDVDTILTEISKTSERSAESLEKLGETAFDAASKYGVSVQNYLTGVQEMARAGYETLGEHQSEQMAELALLVQAAGGVSDSVARDYLIATDAAYQLGGSIEKLTSILDSQNMVTNNYAVSMQDMTEATKEAASVANQYGVSIEELSALIAIAEARTKQGGNVVGNAIKSILLQTQDITNNQVVKAFDTVGISMYKIVDGAKLLKTPIELLKELADVFKTLPKGDDRISTVLSDIGGKYRANTLAAILQDWDSMQGIMETYERGAGSAMREANFYLYVQKCA